MVIGKPRYGGVDTPGGILSPALRKQKRVPFWQDGLPLVGRFVGDCVQCLVERLVTRWVRSLTLLAMLTKWSHPTRLETRIKESNIRASAEVANLHA